MTYKKWPGWSQEETQKRIKFIINIIFRHGGFIKSEYQGKGRRGIQKRIWTHTTRLLKIMQERGLVKKKKISYGLYEWKLKKEYKEKTKKEILELLSDIKK